MTHTTPTPPTPRANLPRRIYPYITPTGAGIWTTPTEARQNGYTNESTRGVHAPHRATFTFAADAGTTGELLVRIDRFLPRGWHAYAAGRSIGIYGNDHAGWTLHDYVLPRLASGCIYPTAITPEATQ